MNYLQQGGSLLLLPLSQTASSLCRCLNKSLLTVLAPLSKPRGPPFKVEWIMLLFPQLKLYFALFSFDFTRTNKSA